jgi:hypothetical protein
VVPFRRSQIIRGKKSTPVEDLVARYRNAFIPAEEFHSAREHGL